MKTNHKRPEFEGTSYKGTIYACFTGYGVQAIINNFAPLLFLTFGTVFHIPFSQITLLVTFNFGVQLLTDLLSAYFVERIGYRVSIVMAHVFAAGGLISLAVLPRLLPDPFMGLLMAVSLYAVGGGLIEVLISPIMEACPSDDKGAAMSLLHSFYCWGHVAVVLVSTLFFAVFGIENWELLAVLWALVPIVNGIAFSRVPMNQVLGEGERGLSVRELLGSRIFWILILIMICAGASEQAVSQWASTFAEQELGISKSVGDLAGPMTFAILMGLSRAYYGKMGGSINLERYMSVSCVLCVISYLMIALVPVPMIGLMGFGLSGLSVGIMWPGGFSKAARAIPGGGTAMYAFLALAGDLGCNAGPTLAGAVSGFFHNNLRIGILAALIFPAALFAAVRLCREEYTGDADPGQTDAGCADAQ